jgi:hypothetical protein
LTIAITNSKTAPTSDRVSFLLAALFATVCSAFAVYWTWSHGWTLYWGDAEAHLNTARRIVESRHTGYEQLGIPWLPLPHLLMVPFVLRDSLWRSGLAGAIPSAICFVIASLFLFAAIRRELGEASAWCAMALFVLNPNALYLQSIPMTEAVFFATLFGILFFTTRYRDTQSIGDLAGSALLCVAGSLARYEGVILIPFAAIYILLVSKRSRFVRAVGFGVVACVGVAWWLFYNWWMTGYVLYFYNGQGSAAAIQGGVDYLGHGDWRLASQYYFTAGKLVAGWPLVWLGGFGLIVAFVRRAWWPVLLLAIPPLFYVWQIHSGASPIHIPVLKPFSWYNTRYALAMLPLLAVGASAFAWNRKFLVCLPVILAGASFWLFHLHPDDCITWKESQVNSEGRRARSRAAAQYLEAHGRDTDTYFTTFGDITTVFRVSGIHLSRTLTWDDWPEWQAAVFRPDLFLWEDWAVAERDSPVDKTVRAAQRSGPRYDFATEIRAAGAPPIEIYHRHEYPFH